jgi:hypothetical protein
VVDTSPFVDDHQALNNIDFEPYINVSYTAPAIIVPSGGDFKIIAMAASKLY